MSRVLDPDDYFSNTGEKEFYDNTTAYLNDLLDKANIDEAANKETVRQYKAELAKIDKLKADLKKAKTLKIVAIVGAVIAALICFIGLSLIAAYAAVGVCLALFGFVAEIVVLSLLTGTINSTIDKHEKLCKPHQGEADELLKKAQDQVFSLNRLFRDDDVLRLIEKTMPEVKMNNYLSASDYARIVDDYDFHPDYNPKASMINSLSGSYSGNPFLFIDHFSQSMYMRTYTGSRNISWTETEKEDGRVVVKTYTQTLYASIKKPCPIYEDKKVLFYGSSAAPDLSFSRKPQHSERLDELRLKARVDRRAKRIARLTEEATKTGGSFQGMSNETFDSLFDALDRNNETQFRFLFTPLAQENMTDLMTLQTGYGDDFSFTKNHRANCLEFEHLNRWKFCPSARNYYSYDLEKIKKDFVSYSQDYFKNFFFCLAPLLAIPAYTEKAEEETERKTESNFSWIEYETVANAIGVQFFASPDAKTDSILKSDFIRKEGNSDIVAITAYSFDYIQKTEQELVCGGDNDLHLVTIPYLEYFPVSRTTKIKISPALNGVASWANTENFFVLRGLAVKIL